MLSQTTSHPPTSTHHYCMYVRVIAVYPVSTPNAAFYTQKKLGIRHIDIFRSCTRRRNVKQRKQKDKHLEAKVQKELQLTVALRGGVSFCHLSAVIHFFASASEIPIACARDYLGRNGRWFVKDSQSITGVISEASF